MNMKEKICKLNTPLQATQLIFIFINKLPTEVDELGHVDGNLNNETERQKALEKEINCVFIRINPDEKDFNIFKEIKKIYRDKTQSKEENKRTRKKKTK